MSLAKKCDRCGNLYESKDMDICGAIVNGLSLIDRDKQNSRVVNRKCFDLCPECLAHLANWLKNKPTKFNEIQQAVGPGSISERDNVFVKLCSEKENKNDKT